MIRHIVAWRLAATDPAERQADAERIALGLQQLVPIIDEIQHLTVGVDVGAVDGNWDLAFWADFASLEALAAYQLHPAHQEFAALPRALAAERMCVDLEL